MSTYHLNLLTLLELSSVGRRTVQQLLHTFDRAHFNHQPIHEQSDILNHLFYKPGETQLNHARKRAETILDHAQKTGVQLVGYGEKHYPDRLNVLADFPVVLFVRGDPAAMHRKRTVSITGSRRAGEKALEITETYTRKLAESGWHLVSGLTKGCETAAHRGALQASMPAVVVLGSGLDHVHPRSSTRMAEKILEKGGCWVSEHPNGTRVYKRQLIERDRIRSALSDGVLLIQESFSGHAMHTVRFAKSQGKPLAVLDPKHRAVSGDSTGNNFLVKANAGVPIRNDKDLEHFINNLTRYLQKQRKQPRQSAESLNNPIQLSFLDDIQASR